VDPVNDRVRRIDAQTGIITTFAGTLKGFSGDGGPAMKAKLNNPSSITFDSDGSLYIAEFVNNRVRRVDAKTGTITTIAGLWPTKAHSCVDVTCSFMPVRRLPVAGHGICTTRVTLTRFPFR
jgi:sugar lactone lactonase YvrE